MSGLQDRRSAVELVPHGTPGESRTRADRVRSAVPFRLATGVDVAGEEALESSSRAFRARA